MPVFSCPSDERFKNQKIVSALTSGSTILKESDLKIFWGKYCLAMEQFIKEKGLFEEFQNLIKPTVNFDCEVVNADSTR